MEPQHPGLPMRHPQHDQVGPMRQIRPGLRLDSIGDRPIPPIHHEMHEVGQRPKVSRNRTTSESAVGLLKSSHTIGGSRPTPIHRNPPQLPPPSLHHLMHSPQQVSLNANKQDFFFL